jgi:hypothetical protein
MTDEERRLQDFYIKRTKVYEVLYEATQKVLKDDPDIALSHILGAASLFLVNNIKVCHKLSPMIHVATLQHIIDMLDNEDIRLDEDEKKSN